MPLNLIISFYIYRYFPAFILNILATTGINLIEMQAMPSAKQKSPLFPHLNLTPSPITYLKHLCTVNSWDINEYKVLLLLNLTGILLQIIAKNCAVFYRIIPSHAIAVLYKLVIKAANILCKLLQEDTTALLTKMPVYLQLRLLMRVACCLHYVFTEGKTIGQGGKGIIGCIQ